MRLWPAFTLPLRSPILPDSLPWWSPEAHARRRGYLASRGAIKAAMRAWFGAEGFMETECGQLQRSPGNEAHLHGFETDFIAENGTRTPLYLHTSPEFAMKKLLAAGETRIFDFARTFRNRDTGLRHVPEFTMLWNEPINSSSLKPLSAQKSEFTRIILPLQSVSLKIM